jgi:simple sugar transport system ATP-binding protein
MENLQAKQLGKSFPGVVALQGVDISIGAGSIHALVGANGAGKSTLIKILTGFYDQYEGDIFLNGQQAAIQQPTDALNLGIQVVHQEVDTVLIPYLTAAENLLIEDMAEPGSRLWVSPRGTQQRAAAIAQRVNLKVDLDKRVEDLAMHEKQMLVIARAISQDARYLILDEPTASLGLREVEQLFANLADLKAHGVGMIYVSHRLGEVKAIADEVTVLRGGRKVGHFVGDIDLSAVVEAMLGMQPEQTFQPPVKATPGPVILRTRDLSRKDAVHAVSLEARQGEVLGITGLVGAGKTELLRLIYGADAADQGQMWLNDRALRIKSPSHAVNNGIFLVPEERRKQGVLVEDSVRKNLTLPFLELFTRLGLTNKPREEAYAEGVIQRVDLTPPDPEMKVKNLSGGNQQKVVVGKWFAHAPAVMLFDEATFGIDIKTKQDIYRLAHDLSKEAAVLYASSDIDEVLNLADRVLVMRDGAVVANFSRAEATRRAVLEYATGARDRQENESDALPDEETKPDE